MPLLQPLPLAPGDRKCWRERYCQRVVGSLEQRQEKKTEVLGGEKEWQVCSLAPEEENLQITCGLTSGAPAVSDA